MPIDSPAGPLNTLEDIVQAAKRGVAMAERFVTPVLLVVAPQEEWGEITQARPQVERDSVSVKMFPTFVIEVKGTGPISFGRGPMNRVILPFAAMSKAHGVIQYVGDAWEVSDAGSKNGTFVDGKRIHQGGVLPLRDGASLRFGDVTAKFWLPQTFLADLERRTRT
ncbi:MAG: FHA domain-containing protein [Myxococcaceae bacterium]